MYLGTSWMVFAPWNYLNQGKFQYYEYELTDSFATVFVAFLYYCKGN